MRDEILAQLRMLWTLEPKKGAPLVFTKRNSLSLSEPDMTSMRLTVPGLFN